MIPHVGLRRNVYSLTRKTKRLLPCGRMRNDIEILVVYVTEDALHENGNGKHDGEMVHVHAALLQSAVRVDFDRGPVDVEEGTVFWHILFLDTGRFELAVPFALPVRYEPDDTGTRVLV